MQIFTETKTMLAAEFVDSFAAEKLALTLHKVGQATGVEFNRKLATFVIEGHWKAIVDAHTTLENMLLDEMQLKERPCRVPYTKDDDNTKAKTVTRCCDINKDNPKVMAVIANESSRRGRKPGHTLTLNRNCDIPEPLIFYPNESEKTSHKTREMLKPSNLIDEINAKCETKHNQVLNNTDYEGSKGNEETSKTDETARMELSNSAISNDIKSFDDCNYKIDIKREILKTDDTLDDDDATDIDEQYLTEANPETTEDTYTEVKVKIELADSEMYTEADITVTCNSLKQEPTSENDEKSDKEIILNTETVKSPKRKHGRTNVEEDENVQYPCELCSYIGKKKDHLKEHVKRKHTSRFSCDVCEKKFGFNKDLNRHKRQVHGDPAHFCDICNKLYKCKKAYVCHMETHEDNYIKPSFDCKLCDKTFSTKYVLASHIKGNHLGMNMNKIFMCPTCGQTYSNKSSYLSHANMHAGIKPYVCDVCGKSFSYVKSLKEHKFTHDDVRRFQCDICQKAFQQPSSLRKHEKVHKESRDYICSSCGKGFTQKQALLRHERIHSGDKPYSCSLCSRTFSDYSIIRRHMILIHKKDTKSWRTDVIY